MIVIVSDIHMMDRDTGASVSDQELIHFVDTVRWMRPAGEPLEIVLLGDIIDFLRSPEWDKVWPIAPWTEVGRNFGAFQNSRQEEVVLGIAERVSQKYGGFSRKLRKLKEAGGVKIRYVAGNHDYSVQVSQKLRDAMKVFLALDDDPSARFPLQLWWKKHRLLAMHGNHADLSNQYMPSQGAWAVGDAVVLRIVNRFGSLASRALGVSRGHPLHTALHEIDNVEPHSHIPLYVLWLAETYLKSDDRRLLLWHTLVRVARELLELDEFQKEPYPFLLQHSGVPRWLAGKFKSFRNRTFLKTLSELLPAGTDYAAAADRLRLGPGRPKIIVFGHTHEPGVHALPTRGKDRAYYVNTGAWRKVISLPAGETGNQFSSFRTSAFFVAYDRKSTSPNGVPFQLVSQCHL